MCVQGVFRAVLGAGEAVNFGVDSIGVPYVKEAGVILAFFATGVGCLLYLALFEIKETMYFQEAEVVVPHHVYEEKGLKDPHQGQDVANAEDKEKDQPQVHELTEMNRA